MKNENKNSVIWYENSFIISGLSIFLCVLILILSQSFAINNGLTASEILRNIINHNIIYLLSLIYFIGINTNFGKRHFDFFGIFLLILYLICSFTSLLTVFQSFSLNTLLSLALKLVLFVYMFHSLIKKTRVWDEFSLDNSPFNELTNDNFFYFSCIISVILLCVNLIDANTIDGAILSLLDCFYYLIMSRYIYLYRCYIDGGSDLFFGKIEKVKVKLPKWNSISRNVKTRKLNFYQTFSVVVFCVCFFIGIILGNIFPSCGNSATIYSKICYDTEFNFSFMIFFWFVSLILCLFFYGLGTIIQLLSSINDKLSKKS